jgi:phosphoserine phosphatase
LRHFSVNYFQRDNGIQDRVAGAICYRHRAGAELNRKTIRANLDFEVMVFQLSRR